MLSQAPHPFELQYRPDQTEIDEREARMASYERRFDLIKRQMTRLCRQIGFADPVPNPALLSNIQCLAKLPYPEDLTNEQLDAFDNALGLLGDAPDEIDVVLGVAR